MSIIMKDHKGYGKKPYKIALVHGGPGAAGEMAEVAVHLSTSIGVIELFQTACSIENQVRELKNTLLNVDMSLPMILLGYSWGAMLCLLVASRNPEMFKKIILVSCPPLEDKYVIAITVTRMKRLNSEDQKRFSEIKKLIPFIGYDEKKVLFLELKKLIDKADQFNPESLDHQAPINFRLDIYESIWPEAVKLRQKGTFLECLRYIDCPVVFIHGDDDPHPLEAIQDAASLLKSSKIYVLENCGHTPWVEKKAKKRFYSLLKKEI